MLFNCQLKYLSVNVLHILKTHISVSKGNRKADEEAKKDAQLPAENLLSTEETRIETGH